MHACAKEAGEDAAELPVGTAKERCDGRGRAPAAGLHRVGKVLSCRAPSGRGASVQWP